MAIEFHDLYLEGSGGTILHDAAANLVAGQVHGVVGAGGTGKSTLLALWSGLHHLHSGTLKVLGLNLPTEARRLREQVAVLFQEEAPYPAMTVMSYLRWFGKLLAMTEKDITKDGRALLARLNAEPLWSRRLDRLHPGGQRLVALVRALLAPRPLVLLDEPFAALDDDTRTRLAELLMERRTSGATVVIASNCLAEVERTATTTWRLADHRLERIDAPHALPAAGVRSAEIAAP